MALLKKRIDLFRGCWYRLEKFVWLVRIQNVNVIDNVEGRSLTIRKSNISFKSHKIHSSLMSEVDLVFDFTNFELLYSESFNSLLESKQIESEPSFSWTTNIRANSAINFNHFMNHKNVYRDLWKQLILKRSRQKFFRIFLRSRKLVAKRSDFQ